jgi:hypothetical protein
MLEAVEDAGQSVSQVCPSSPTCTPLPPSTHIQTHLAGHDGLHEEAEHAEHGQATVLDLLDLELSKGVLQF